MLERVGARIWIARIMVFWGLVTIAMMFVANVTMFYLLRFLLGAAEAGFFPGILFYLTRWFRPQDRAAAISLFMTAGTVAGAIGNPLSGSLLLLDGAAGLAGWQWLFLIEGLPAVALGISVLFLLPETPEDARWLTAEESTWLTGQVQAGRPHGHAATSLRQCLAHPAVWKLSAVYFLLVTGAYGFEFWLPAIVKSLNRGSDFQAALLPAVGSHRRATLACRGGPRRLGRGIPAEHPAPALALGRAGGPLDRLGRPEGSPGPILGASAGVSVGNRCRGRHCGDQFDCESGGTGRAGAGRLSGAVHGRLFGRTGDVGHPFAGGRSPDYDGS